MPLTRRHAPGAKSGDRVGALAMIKDVKEQMRRIEELRCGKEESNLDMKEDDTLERRSEMPRGCYDWERHETDEGEYYYYNVVTDVTTWDKPADFIEETLTTVRRIKRRETVATCSRGAIGLGFGLDNGKITTVESASRTRSSTVGEKSSLESSNSSPFGKVKNIFNKRKQKRMSMPAIINEREGGISNTSGMDADDFTLARQRAGSRYKESSSGIIEEADEDEDEHAGVTRLKSPSVILIDDEIMGDDTAADLGKKVSLSSSGVSFEKAAKKDTASDGEAIVLGSRTIGAPSGKGSGWRLLETAQERTMKTRYISKIESQDKHSGRDRMTISLVMTRPSVVMNTTLTMLILRLRKLSMKLTYSTSIVVMILNSFIRS